MFNKKMKAWLAVGALAAVLAVSGCGGNGDMKQGGSEDLKIVGTPKTDVGFVFAMKKENKELQAAVNKALKELKANGEYDKIFEKWFGKAEK